MKKLLVPSALVSLAFGTVATPGVMYYRDVLPILQKHCLACHRPGLRSDILSVVPAGPPLGGRHQTRCGDSENAALVRRKPRVIRPRSRAISGGSQHDRAMGRW